MGELLITALGGSVGAAFVTGVWTLVQYKLRRQDDRADRRDAQNKALRYIMLYIIEERAKEYLREGRITMAARRSLHHWHQLYHEGLGGNGDADTLMRQIDALALDVTEDV